MPEQDDGTITLPEVIVVGDPDQTPTTIADWFAEGFFFGWNHQTGMPEAPAPLDQPFLEAYFNGVAAARSKRDDFDQFQGPAIGPDVGGQPLDEFERGFREALEDLFHEEDKHIEGETTLEIAPGPGVP
ncbi:hypothetical protein [Streptomyces sp. NPDC048106]|uniref:hypothetical protein n=1 Tax=Streptomyces sp. NPDC048106 TaxID=3155750 RepID=UPI00345213D7